VGQKRLAVDGHELTAETIVIAAGSRLEPPPVEGWSPMWDHFTTVWKDPAKVVLVKSQDELDERVKAGEIELFA